MFPHATPILPHAFNTSASMDTVVVLPLVPVTAIAVARRQEKASSSSPVMSLPILRKATGRALSMGMPGLSTSTSHSLAAPSYPSADSSLAPSEQSSATARRTPSPEASSQTYTSAPRARRKRAAATPDEDTPATRNF